MVGGRNGLGELIFKDQARMENDRLMTSQEEGCGIGVGIGGRGKWQLQVGQFCDLSQSAQELCRRLLERPPGRAAKAGELWGFGSPDFGLPVEGGRFGNGTFEGSRHRNGFWGWVWGWTVLDTSRGAGDSGYRSGRRKPTGVMRNAVELGGGVRLERGKPVVLGSEIGIAGLILCRESIILLDLPIILRR